MVVIETRGLTKTYGKVQALQGADLTVEEGKIFGFLGPNGAGKTTMIKILTGLIPPTSGTCLVNGFKTMEQGADHRRNIGYLSQKPAYYPWMTGEELLNFVGELFNIPTIERKRRTKELLEIAGLGKAGKRRISGYSGGMVQRLGIAQAIYNSPKIVFLDEPVSALDPVGRRDVLAFIGSLKKTSTVFMSTHILADVERVCDEVAIIKDGIVLLQEDTEALLRRFATGIAVLAFESALDCTVLFNVLDDGSDTIQVDGSHIRMHAQQFSRNRDRILQFVLEKHLSLCGINEEPTSLEDVFMQIIGKGGSYV